MGSSTPVAGVIVLATGVGQPHQLPIARTFGGSLLVGWGTFNVVEGLIDHRLLGLHHVHPGARMAEWDVAFVVLSAILVMIGALVLVRTSARVGLRPADTI